MRKQLPLTGVPAAERAPLVLSGEAGTLEFEVDDRPWPMPEKKEPVQLDLAQRIALAWNWVMG